MHGKHEFRDERDVKGFREKRLCERATARDREKERESERERESESKRGARKTEIEKDRGERRGEKRLFVFNVFLNVTCTNPRPPLEFRSLKLLPVEPACCTSFVQRLSVAGRTSFLLDFADATFMPVDRGNFALELLKACCIQRPMPPRRHYPGRKQAKPIALPSTARQHHQTEQCA